MSGTNRRMVAWAFYDWANSAFATTVLAGFFPLFFREEWSAGHPSGTITFRLGVANAIGSVAVALLSPVLGAIADAGGLRKRMLALFALLGVVGTAALAFVARGEWRSAAAFFVIASIGFMGANVFYDSMLIDAAPPDRRDRASALGYGLGYLGGGLLFALNAAMVMTPETFGIADRGAAVRAAFLTVAVWWAVFTVPLLLLVRVPRGAFAGLALVREGLRDVRSTLSSLRRLRATATFLVAYWLYIDGVDTVIRMAGDFGLALGLAPTDLMGALLLVQLVGFPAAIVFGRIGERIGAKNGILVGLAVYCVICVAAALVRSTAGFYAVAVAIALVQGGVQALSRSLFASFVPPEREAQFFGFYNMLGKFAAVFGPLLVGVVGELTGSPRAGMASVLVLFLAGGAILLRTPSGDLAATSGGR